MWIKNTGGKKDAALTMMIVAFVFSLGLALLGAVETVNLGNKSFSFRPFDMGFATTVLVPLIALFISDVNIPILNAAFMTTRQCGSII